MPALPTPRSQGATAGLEAEEGKGTAWREAREELNSASMGGPPRHHGNGAAGK